MCVVYKLTNRNNKTKTGTFYMCLNLHVPVYLGTEGQLQTLKIAHELIHDMSLISLGGCIYT